MLGAWEDPITPLDTHHVTLFMTHLNKQELVQMDVVFSMKGDGRSSLIGREHVEQPVSVRAVQKKQ